VAFPDDDVWFANDALERAAAAVGRWGGIVTAGIEATSGRPRWKTATAPRPLGRGRELWTHAAEAAFFIDRPVWAASGGFDESLGLGAPTAWQSGEGTDLLLRCLASGVPVTHDPSIRLFEENADPANVTAAANKHRHYGRGMGHVYRMHYGPFGCSAMVARTFAKVALASVTGSRRRVRLAVADLTGRTRGLWDPL
jgi:hypothetical protein